LVAVDAAYVEPAKTSVAAAVVFEDWRDASPASEYVAELNQMAAYVPGQFYRRELPILLAVLEQVREPVDAVVIDGFVQLGEKPGLGMHLWEARDGRFAVIGVAKSPFRGAGGVPVSRGASRQPLYVTAVGMDVQDAAQWIEAMHGPHRLPVLLKRADRLARERAAKLA
jgi:deoxyribonuclease V